MSHKISHRGIMMWCVASFFYAYQYILRLLPNVTMFDLMQQFQIDAELFGQLSGIYYLGYALMHIPLGILLDRIGPKIILPLCMLLCGLGLVPFIMADNWVYPCLGRFLIGIGSSGAILGVFKIIRLYFEEAKFTRMLGFSVTIGLLGAIYGGWPVHWMLKTFGMHHTFIGFSLFAIFLAGITYLIVPATQSIHNPVSKDLKSVFYNARVLIICILAGCMVGPLEGFADGWSGGFFQVVYGLSAELSASMPAMIFIGMSIGAPILSVISQKYNCYYQMIVASAVIMCLCFGILLAGQAPVTILGALLFVVGVFCAYQILAIYKASCVAGPQVVGLTSAVANMIIMSFGYLFHAGIGKLMVIFWDGKLVENVPQYTTSNYTKALSLIPIMLLIALVGYALLAHKESKMKAT